MSGRRAGELVLGVLPLAAGAALALLLHVGVPRWLGPFHEKLLMDIGIAIMLAVSLNLVNGLTGQFSIGHAGFMAVGGYAAGAITFYGSHLLWGSAAPQPGLASPGAALFVLACLAGGLLAAVMGCVVGLPSLRLRGDYLAIVTLGFGEILRVLLQRTGDVVQDTAEIRATPLPGLLTHLGGSLGFTGLPYYSNLFWIYLFASLTLVAAHRLKRSSYGRAFLAIRGNEIAAEAVGVPATRFKVLAFVLAAFFGGIAGGLFAHEVGTSLNPRELGFQKSFDIVIMVVLGGMGSISGSVLAAIVLTLLPELLRGFAAYRMPVYALLLILMMILRPQGLFGLRELWELGPFRRLRARRAGGLAVSGALLEAREVSLSFGGLKAVSGFALELPRGALHALIGPNGAGKTTVFNILTGVYAPDAGSIGLEGRSLVGMRPHRIAEAGVARTFQNIRLFPELSVLDNVRVACELRSRGGLAAALLRSPAERARERATLERARELLALFGLERREDEAASALPYGDQRRLEIARALATEPKLLLLDEPAAGMNARETGALAELIHRLRDEFGLTILLIEHDVGLVMQICDRITVLDYGLTIACGAPREVQSDPRVIEAYLGEPGTGTG